MEFEDGASHNSAKSPVRFVLLLHTLPDAAPQSTHWDLMICQGDSLLTFALQSLPPQTREASGLIWPATRLPDHRLNYLEYEGVIAPAQPGGADRGSVRRVAAGWAVCEVDPQAAQSHRWRLSSPQLQAVFAYTPCAVGASTQLLIESWNVIESRNAAES